MNDLTYYLNYGKYCFVGYFACHFFLKITCKYNKLSEMKHILTISIIYIKTIYYININLFHTFGNKLTFSVSNEIYLRQKYFENMQFMKKLLPLLFAFISFHALYSQNCNQAVWLKSFGGNSSYNAIVDGGRRSDSLFTICGSFGNGSLNLENHSLTAVGFYHYFLATHDTAGTILNASLIAWYSNSGDYCVIKKIHIGVDNSVYVTGYWKGSTVHIGDSLLPTVTVNRAFMASFNANLQPVWVSHTSKTYADCQANGIASDQYKNVYVVGSFEDNIFKIGTLTADNYGGNNMWRDDAFFLKLDSLGHPVYVKNIGTPVDDAAFSVVCDTSGGVYIFGHSGISTTIFKFDDQIALPGSVAGASLFYGKYDGVSGDCIWGKMGGSHYSSGYLNIYDIAMADYQSIIICGKIIGQANLYPYTYNTYDENGFVAKFDLNGNSIWLKTIGGQNSSEMATRVSYYNNKIAVCGSLFSNHPYLGNFPLYSTLSGGSYKAFNATLDTNGTVLFARLNKLVSSGSDHYYNGIALLDDYNGQILWGNFKGSQSWYPLTQNNTLSYGKLFAVRFLPVNTTPALTVSAGPDKIANCGTSVQLNGSITPSTNVAYGWYPDLGFSSNGSKTPYVNPGTPTTYILYATYNGCTISDTVSVTYGNHDLSVTVPDSYTFCSGDSVQIVTTCNQPTATFSWAPSAYINTSTSQNPFVKPPLTTQYVVTATYNGCIASDTVQVFSRLKPNIALPKQDMYNMWRTHLCQDDTIDITFGDPNYTYTTTTPNMLLNFTGNTAQLLPVSGILRMQAVSQFGCTSTDSLGVIVHNNLPAPLVTGNVINREKCPGDTAYFNVILTNSANINFQYSWYAGWQVDSLNGTGWRDIDYYDADFEITNYSVGYPSSTYYSKLKLNSINSNMNGFKYRPYVHDYCSPRGYGNAGLIIVGAQILSHPIGYSVCDSSSASLSVSVNSSQLYSFRWYEDNQLINSSFTNITGYNSSTLQFNPITLGQNNKQYVCEVLNTQCNVGVFTTPAQFQVNANPDVQLTGLNDFYCVYHAPSIMSGFPVGGSFSGPGVIGNQFNPSLAGVGLWPVVYEFSDANQCYSSDTVWVEVDGCSGVAEEKNSQISIYPNPTNGKILIKAESSEPIEVALYSSTGSELLKSFVIEQSPFTIDISRYSNGIYLLKIRQVDKVYFEKVLLSN
jgi:hypothetical protein